MSIAESRNTASGPQGLVGLWSGKIHFRQNFFQALLKLANAILLHGTEADFSFFVLVHQPLYRLKQGRHGIEDSPGDSRTNSAWQEAPGI